MQNQLPVVESFHSIQGEGAHTGRSAFFIRLGGCKVGCPWCDTKDSWPTNTHQKQTVEKISQEAMQAATNGAAFVVLTGGEPLHHNLDPLCNAIRKRSFISNKKYLPIHLETSGVDQISGNPNWITLSPKRHAPPRVELLGICNELKVVINEKDDLVFAEKMALQALQSKTNHLKLSKDKNALLENPVLFVQPGWDNAKGLALALEYVKQNPQWRLSVQSHKWLGVL